MWLHPDFQEEAPEPNDEEVEVTDFPEVSVYVRTFGGFASESSVLNEVKALHEELNKDKVEFEDDVAYVAVYDSAWKLFNRHNGESVFYYLSPPQAKIRQNPLCVLCFSKDNFLLFFIFLFDCRGSCDEEGRGAQFGGKHLTLNSE